MELGDLSVSEPRAGAARFTGEASVARGFAPGPLTGNLVTLPHNGSILIQDGVLGWPWELPAPQFKVLIQLLILASREDDRRLRGDRFVEIRRGQLCETVTDLAAHAGTSEAAYRRALKVLKEHGFIRTRKAGRSCLVVTVVNYDRYQPAPADVPAPRGRGSKTGVARDGASLQDVHRANAVRRWNRVEVESKRATSDGRGAKASRPNIIIDAWRDADPLDWIGLFDLRFEKVHGGRSAELLAMTRKEFRSLIPVVKRAEKILTEWFGKVDPSRVCLHAWMLVKWVFDEEKSRNQWAVENGVGKRNPITVRDAFSPATLNKWFLSRQVKHRRAPG